ncbi:initiation factor 2 subunit family-domain-containing protein [Sphaerosporella brunnea]|uniref:Translation initiation factor eIF2B subunit delta n=1 Tax=Sphaerosporella brunnea TaxID=1250544 RepID=A0A5J5EMP2_9PEZI|nr:initiation factor 2 subunit family-domain-containing protein [Sphaerosporella brunnea]
MSLGNYQAGGEDADAVVLRSQVIEDYETPENSSLNRHLPGAYLSHQINYLTSARPMATAMGNTIRWLKTEISKISPDITDEAAKRHLVNAIENFIHERLTAAGDVIINTTCERYIEDHDVILVFAKSQLVEKTLLEAKRRGKQFRVIVVDSHPLEEGRNLLACLCENGIEAEYIHLYALDFGMQGATKVFLGANAVMANGALYSRSGTAVVALAAQAKGVPVLVLCETVKFSEKINIDGIVNNELAPPDLLVNVSRHKEFPEPGYLEGWRDVPNTMVVNFMYDVTPAECLTLVICEHGCVTAEGVSAVLRMSGMDR